MNNTKKELFTSVISLILCISMLLGTTLAWFTDEVTSGTNRIVAGNLDVEVYWAESYDGPWYELNDPDHSVVFDYDLWEPGYTQVRYVKIVNKGTLALKYKLNIEPAGPIGEIAQVLDVTYMSGVTAAQAAAMDERAEFDALTKIGVLNEVITGLHTTTPAEGVILPEGETPWDEDIYAGETICMMGLHMQEDAGNEYQGASIGEGFYITAVATQYSFEDDSFGSDYDEDIVFPEVTLPQTITTAITLDDSNVVEADTNLDNGSGITALVQAGTKFEDGTTEAVLSVALVSQSGNIYAGDDTISRTLDVHVAGVSDSNTTPIIITIENALPINMNLGAITLYHTENNVQNLMSRKNSLSDVIAHNDYYYNSTNGSVTMALQSFSEILFEVSTSNKWDGGTDSTLNGEGTEEDPYLIATVAQLAYIAEQVNDGNNYSGKYFKLTADLIINDWNEVTEAQLSAYNNALGKSDDNKDITAKGLAEYNDPAFEQKGKTYNDWTPIGDGSNEFSGTFDGAGHTISGLFKLHYTDPMDSKPFGLFGWVHDGTIKNLTIEDSFIYTYGGTVGLVAAYASGSTTFENVKVKNNFVTSYNYPLGGILGMAWQANADDNASIIDDVITFTNVTVDNTNLLEALWGTYDSSVGGIVGTAYPNTKIVLNTVTSYPEMSLYNDCCANYQWFAYRYSGMLIGYVRASNRAAWLKDNLTCSDVVVKYGEWTDQYYCERVELGKGSYNGEHEWKYERISKDAVLRDENGNVTGCDTSKTGHDHSGGKTYTYKGQTYTTTSEDEDNVAINISFNQLFGGGQGVYGEDVNKYAEYCDKNPEQCGIKELGAEDGVGSISVKFPNTDKYLYRVGNKNAISIGTLFEAEGGTNIKSNGVTLTAQKITGVTSVSYNPDTNKWENGTLKFEGTGVIKLIIEYRGVATELNLEVVDAVNATSATSATSNNVVLVSDVSAGGSSIIVSNGYALYGNGFRMTFTGNGAQSKANVTNYATAYVNVNGGTLDNVQIKCAQYDGSYGSVPGDNPSISNNSYPNVMPAVTARGNGVIQNCYIYGARVNIFSDGGNITVKDTVCECAATANIQLWSSSDYTVTLDNVTTIQYLYNNNKVYGFGVLNGHDESPSNAKLLIENGLTQYNWVNSSTANSLTSDVAKKAIQEAVSKTAYQHSYNGTNYVNLGVAYLNNTTHEIVDNRANAADYSYSDLTISAGILGTYNGGVYSVKSGRGSVAFKDGSYVYNESANTVYEPQMRLKSDLGGQKIDYDPDADEYCYVDSDSGVLIVTFLAGSSKQLDLASMMSIAKYTGQDLSLVISCVDESGSALPVANGKVTLTEQKDYTITYTVTDRIAYNKNGELTEQNKVYSKTVPMNVTLKDDTIQNAEFEFDASKQKYCISGTRNIVQSLPFLNGLKIYDYDYGTSTRYLRFDGDESNAYQKIAKYEHNNNTDHYCITKLWFVDGGTLELKYLARCDGGGGSTYTTTLKTYNGVLYAVNGGTTSSTGGNKWVVQYYKFTGNNGETVTSPAKTFTQNPTTLRPNSTFSASVKNTVTFDPNGGKCAQSVAYTTSSAMSVTLPTPTRSGFSFDGWYTAATGGTKCGAAGETYKPGSNETLYAHWKAPYTVTFDADGGTSCASVKNDSGTVITLPATTQSTQWFTGWYDGETRVGGAGGSYTIPERNVTLTAHWSPKYYVIYDMTNGGTVSTGSITNPLNGQTVYGAIYEGTAITLPTPTPGAQPTFEGWFTAVSGGTKVGGAGDSYTPAANTTLYAQWSTNVPVSFDANGGECGTSAASYDGVTPITLPAATRAGHAFNGWYTASSGGTKVGNGGASYTPTEATTLHAQWTAYTVSFDGNGATNPTALSANSNGTVTLPTPTRTGYTFNGWYTETSGGTKIGNGGASYTPTADTTLHAQWTINSYKVTITTNNSTTAVTANGATVSNGGSVAYNSVVKVVLGYTQTDSLTFTIKQGSTTVARYSDEACTSSTTSTDAATYYFKMPAGDVTIDSSSKAPSSGSDFCVAAGTLISMADGTQKPVEELTGDELLLVWNLETGSYDAAPIVFVDSDAAEDYEILHTCFSDGTDVEVVYEHGFFDVTLGKYVYINESTLNDYIGHEFIKSGDISDNEWNVVTLDNVWVETRNVKVYSPVTAKHLCYYTNGILSMPGGIDGLFNIFDVNTDTMRYDEEAMNADIEMYGLLTLNDYDGMITEEMFEAFNGQYLGVAVGKGMITWEDIAYLAERYAPLCE